MPELMKVKLVDHSDDAMQEYTIIGVCDFRYEEEGG